MVTAQSRHASYQHGVLTARHSFCFQQPVAGSWCTTPCRPVPFGCAHDVLLKDGGNAATGVQLCAQGSHVKAFAHGAFEGEWNIHFGVCCVGAAVKCTAGALEVLPTLLGL